MWLIITRPGQSGDQAGVGSGSIGLRVFGFRKNSTIRIFKEFGSISVRFIVGFGSGIVTPQSCNKPVMHSDIGS